MGDKTTYIKGEDKSLKGMGFSEEEIKKIKSILKLMGYNKKEIKNIFKLRKLLIEKLEVIK